MASQCEPWNHSTRRVIMDDPVVFSGGAGERDQQDYALATGSAATAGCFFFTVRCILYERAKNKTDHLDAGKSNDLYPFISHL